MGDNQPTDEGGSLVCPHCFAHNAVEAAYCSKCGKPLRAPIAAKKGNSARTLTLIIIIILVVFALAGISNRGSGASNTGVSVPSSKTEFDARPLEYRLAVLNAKRLVADDDITVARFRYLLGNISEMTGAGHEHIADVAVTVQNHLRDDYGKQMGLLDIMENLNSLVEAADGRVSLDEVGASMIVVGGR